MTKNKILALGLVVLIFAASMLIIIFKWPQNDNYQPAQENAVTDGGNDQTEISAENKDQKINGEKSDIMENFRHIITIKTNMGDIKIETYDADAPKTVSNFITLTKRGFYDGVMFHRVIDGFMIQGGDPTGTGRGGPGYAFEDELNPKTESYKIGYKKGVVAMANSGPNTNGSQFFIMVADYPLPNTYSIFGKVIEGQEIADAISKVKTDSMDKPLSNVVMEEVTILEKTAP